MRVFNRAPLKIVFSFFIIARLTVREPLETTVNSNILKVRERHETRIHKLNKLLFGKI